MNKALRTVCVTVIIAVLSVAIGLFAQHLKNEYDLASHPQKYSEFVEKYAAEYNVPEAVCYAVIKCESGFDPTAVSRAGAVGLMQITPATFTYLCSRTGDDYEAGMLYDPETNIRYGISYLSMLYDRFGVWETVFAAYNCGPTRVDGWIRDGKVNDSGRLTSIPIAETAAYVERVTKAIEKYQDLYYTTEGENEHGRTHLHKEERL